MLIFFDCETTGLEAFDRICSVGFITQDEVFYELIKPPRKIRPEASALQHITNEMVANKKCFEDSKTQEKLAKLNSKENILVSHNVAFDLQMLQKEGFVWQGAIIDTLKCTRHLIPECEQYALQFLRYELKLYQHELQEAKPLEITLAAHHALSDALHVKLLYTYLLDMATQEQLVDLSMEHALITKFAFGKYKGRYLEEIALSDPGYLQWMLGNMFDMDDDLRYSVEYYLAQS